MKVSMNLFQLWLWAALVRWRESSWLHQGGGVHWTHRGDQVRQWRVQNSLSSGSAGEVPQQTEEDCGVDREGRSQLHTDCHWDDRSSCHEAAEQDSESNNHHNWSICDAQDIWSTHCSRGSPEDVIWREIWRILCWPGEGRKLFDADQYLHSAESWSLIMISTINTRAGLDFVTIRNRILKLGGTAE